MTEPNTFYIEALAVDPYHRRHGLATHLLHHAQKTAVAKGYQRLALDVDPHNIAALRLYQKVGFYSEKLPSYTSKFRTPTTLRLVKYL